MAGSFEDCITDISMLENLSDCGQAMHQMLWLIESQIGRERAMQLIEGCYYPMQRGDAPPDAAMKAVDEMFNSAPSGTELR